MSNEGYIKKIEIFRGLTPQKEKEYLEKKKRARELHTYLKGTINNSEIYDKLEYQGIIVFDHGKYEASRVATGEIGLKFEDDIDTN